MSNEEKILAVLEQHGEMLAHMQGDINSLKSDVGTLKSDVSHIKIRLDMDIEKKLNLLAEGHETLLETLAPKDRVQRLEDEVEFLKSVVKAMGQEIAALKKAQ